MAADFRALLAKPMDDVKRPIPLPQGTFHGLIGKHSFGESRNKKTPFVSYELTLQSHSDDIEDDAMEGIELAKRTLSVTYYLTEDALYRAKEFLQSVGVATEGRALGECLPEAVNARVLVGITQRNSEDGTQIFNDVGLVRGEE
jgi:hypothetical protein